MTKKRNFSYGGTSSHKNQNSSEKKGSKPPSNMGFRSINGEASNSKRQTINNSNHKRHFTSILDDRIDLM
jgi:hypothetical protein